MWEQVIVCDVLWITELITLNLVNIYTLSEFVCLTEGYYGNFVLAGNITDHRSTHVRYQSAIAKDVARSNE